MSPCEPNPDSRIREILRFVGKIDAIAHEPAEDLAKGSTFAAEMAVYLQTRMLLSDEAIRILGGRMTEQIQHDQQRLRFLEGRLARTLYHVPHKPLTPEAIRLAEASVARLKRALIETALDLRGAE